MKGTGLPWLTTALRSPHTLQESTSSAESVFPIKKRQYPLGSPRFPVPRTPEATYEIQAVISATLLVGLAPGQARWLWDDFFSNPAMSGEVGLSYEDREKIPVTVKEEQELRRVALCSVYRHPNESTGNRPRLAVLGQLTILKDTKRNTALSSWFEPSLHTSTRSLQLGLERIPGIRVDNALGASRLQIVIAENEVVQFESARTAIERSAWVAGIQPEFLLADPARYENTKASLASRASKHALFIGSFSNNSLYEAFVNLRGPESAIQFDTGLLPGTDEFLNSFRETTARLAGANSDLTIREADQQPKEENRPKLPIELPEKCLHNGKFVYVYDGKTGLWWTRDLAGHGGAVFKTYIQKGKTLQHEAERDAQGSVIEDKHKGAVNMTVHMDELAPCGMTTQRNHLL